MTVSTSPAPTFPSLAWFQALTETADQHPDRYRRLGWVELALGVRIGDDRYRLVFDGYGCTEVSEHGPGDAVDCELVASAADWRELIEHLQARPHADSAHSLNSLVLAGDRFQLVADEQLGADAFYRFNATLQTFIEEAHHLETVFA